MDVKFVILLVCLLTLLPTPGHADFLYNRISPKTPEELDALNLKCVPGRTILKIESVADKSLYDEDGTEEDDGEIETDTRRVHTNFQPKDDSCKICVCSVEGKDEYCSKRPAMNVNECMRMTMIKDSFNKNIPFDHERSLSYRIRRVGDEETECIPFLSEYTDCSEANICTGCTKCSCSAEGNWQCQMVQECPGSGDQDVVNADTISNAYEVLFNELSNMGSKVEPKDSEQQHEESRLLGNYEDLDEGHVSIVKRSVSQNTSIDNGNKTNTNESGTIQAKQVNGVKVPKISRRTSVMDTKNITGISDLHIDFHQPKEFDHHIVDNKIDSLVRNEEKTKILNPNIGEVIGNHSQQNKDKDLSQLVVNELKKGSEVIGNKEIAPVSNITFTPENDTLTAMAFIAGDLLSKLWKIEKESSVESMETEVLKHEKLADLLELFKEPLTMRQELFIKNALERLSKALDKDRKLKNVSLCETLASAESILEKITKLLLPKKSKRAKKITTKVRHMNLFGNSDDIKKELKQIMGINSDNLNLTSKDKLVIDYLNIFKMNPRRFCLTQKGIFYFARIYKSMGESYKKFK
ncbi:PREDICTED: uncharacterized protein LOC106102790 [Papilio polytes]|uniref:uncharacterized protein LOC106102790 n=1 Tax=Papilio polytes TaxID=76194 RepID=UPI000675BCA2|nr:PREDICTED: uncharacterized protein LOC106102790 [Papilio polytes]